MANKRSGFSSRIGFVLAAAGSAVGLGNLWRFPYLAAQYGGGIFLLVYLILAVTFGFTLMITEIAIGRKTGLSAVGAYKQLDKRFGFLGALSSIVPIIIFPYYSVIGGWVIKYLFEFASGHMSDVSQDSYFTGFVGETFQPLFWFFLFIAVTAVIVLLGVEKGIEKASKFMMPVLAVLSLVLAVYAVTLPGAWDGVLYYITPDFSRFSANTLLAAMGQLFYSMSLAMGIMITYGSYMQKESDLEKSVTQIEIFDTGIAFIAGLMIIPAVFSFSSGNLEENLQTGPSLMFVTLPKVFGTMGNSPLIGSVTGSLFFLLVFFAALTSSISLMETVVSILRDKFGWGRKLTCIIVAVGALLAGSLSSLGFGVLKDVQPLGMSFLDFFDFISNSVLMPIVALLTSIFIGWVTKTGIIVDEVKISSRFRREKLFNVVLRYVAPVFIIAILLSSVFSAFGWFGYEL